MLEKYTAYNHTTKLNLQLLNKSTKEGDQGDEEETDDSVQRVAKVTQSKRDRPLKSAWPVCSKDMNPKSLARHCREIHAMKATCVDEEGALFLVCNSCRGGVGYPIHVKKVMGKEYRVQCKVKESTDCMQIPWKNVLKTAMYRHLQAVESNCIFPAET